nr:MAG TPA: hypothetical protein [Caudoviricetes sp.]
MYHYFDLPVSRSLDPYVFRLVVESLTINSIFDNGLSY